LKQLDFRILALIVQWVDVHEKCINHPRLLRLLQSDGTDVMTRQFWRAIAQWKRTNRKWASFVKMDPPSSRWELLPVGTDFQIQRKGEDPRFVETDVCIPKGLLPVREGDVLGPQEMINFHRFYRNRIQFGVCLRADIWSYLELEPNLRSAQLAKKVGCAFASAWEVKQDFELWVGYDNCLQM
jgi:hypothetical protein